MKDTNDNLEKDCINLSQEILNVFSKFFKDGHEDVKYFMTCISKSIPVVICQLAIICTIGEIQQDIFIELLNSEVTHLMKSLRENK